MNRRDAVATVPAVLALVLGTSCGRETAEPSERRPFAFTVEVSGSDSALRRYVIDSGGKLQDQGVSLQSGRLVRRLTTTAMDLSTAMDLFTSVHEDRIRLRASALEAGSVFVEPYVCALDPTVLSRVEAGWSVQETHEVLLNEDGTMSLNTDLGRRLSYRCELRSPDGSDVEAVSQRELRSLTAAQGSVPAGPVVSSP